MGRGFRERGAAGAIVSVSSPAAQGLEKCLQFYCTRQPYWDHLDEHIFQRDFNRYWPDLSPQEKQEVLMRSLADLRLVQRMLPDVSTVPASAVFDLLVATRIKRGQGADPMRGSCSRSHRPCSSEVPIPTT